MGVRYNAMAERIIHLLIYLIHSPEPVDIVRIHDDIPEYRDLTGDAFDRAFERDKKHLRHMGITIHVIDKGSQNLSRYFYTIKRDEITLPSIDLTESEAVLVALASKIWDEESQWVSARSAMLKLQSRPDAPDILASSDHSASILLKGEHVPVLVEAIRRRLPVEFAYRGSAATRRVQPWHLMVSETQRYLIAYDLDKEDVRIFKHSRITSIPKILEKEDSFVIPPEHTLARYRRQLLDDPSDTTAIVAIRDGYARDLTRNASRVDDLAGHNLPAGYSAWQIAAPRHFAQQIASYGSDAVVLDPVVTREIIVDHLRTIVEAYSARVQISSEVRAQLESSGQRRRSVSDGRGAAQLQRLVKMIPWIQSRSPVRLDYVLEQFQIDEDQLRKDLDEISWIGMPDFLDRSVFRVDKDALDAGYVDIGSGDVLPALTLNHDEAVSLVMGLKVLQEICDLQQISSIGPIAEVDRRQLCEGLLDKIGQACGLDVSNFSIHLDTGNAEIHAIINEAIASKQRLRLVYDAATSDRRSTPLVDPARIEAADTALYLQAWSLDANGWRNYRLSRIAQATADGEADDHGTPPVLAEDWASGLQLRAILCLKPDAHWIEDQLPVEQSITLDDDTRIVVIKAANELWLTRLLLKLGAAARVVDHPQIDQAVASQAQAALNLYGELGLLM